MPQLTFITRNFPFRDAAEVVELLAHVLLNAHHRRLHAGLAQRLEDEDSNERHWHVACFPRLHQLELCAVYERGSDVSVDAALLRLRELGGDVEHVVGEDGARETIKLRIESPSESTGKYATEFNAWGTVDVLYESTAAGVYRLNVARGHAIPLHVHHIMEEAELVLGRHLHAQGRPAPFGVAHRWGHARHGYENREQGDKWGVQPVLCIDHPPFIPSDEVRVEDGVPDVDVPQSFPAHELWQKVVAGEVGGLSFGFPGALAPMDEYVTLEFPEEYATPDAVLVLALSAADELVLVKHRRRGWELPGGKVDEVDQGSAEVAAAREFEEEAGLQLERDSLRPLCQYTVRSKAGAHVKTVLLARVAADEAVKLERETSAMRLEPHWHALQGLHAAGPSLLQRVHEDQTDEFSALLKDAVLPLSLDLLAASVLKVT